MRASVPEQAAGSLCHCAVGYGLGCSSGRGVLAGGGDAVTAVAPPLALPLPGSFRAPAPRLPGTLAGAVVTAATLEPAGGEVADADDADPLPAGSVAAGADVAAVIDAAPLDDAVDGSERVVDVDRSATPMPTPAASMMKPMKRAIRARLGGATITSIESEPVLSCAADARPSGGGTDPAASGCGVPEGNLPASPPAPRSRRLGIGTVAGGDVIVVNLPCRSSCTEEIRGGGDEPRASDGGSLSVIVLGSP